MTELFNGDIVGRKAHKCYLCGLTIAAGTKHRLAKVKDGGEFASFRYHQHCDRVAVIDKWDDIDWEGSGGDHELFRKRLAELVEQGKIVMPEPEDKPTCDHQWRYVPDPSGNNDSTWVCSKCSKWTDRKPNAASLREGE